MRAISLPMQFILFLALQVALSFGLVYYLSTLADDNYRIFQRSTDGFVDISKSIEMLRKSFASAGSNVEKLADDKFQSGARIDVRPQVVELQQLASAIRNDSALGDLSQTDGGVISTISNDIEALAKRLIKNAESLPSANNTQVAVMKQDLMEARRHIMVDDFGRLISAANRNLQSTMNLIGGSTESTGQLYKILLTLFVSLQIILMVAILWFFNRQIKELADVTDRVLSGEAVHSLDQIKRSDQLGRIARAVQQFRASLISLSNSREQLKAMLKKHDNESISRRKAEHALSETASVFENVQEAVALTDVDGFVNRLNPAAERLLGKNLTDLSGTPLLTYLFEGAEMMVDPIWRQVIDHGYWQGEIEFTGAEKRNVIALVSLQLVGEARINKGHVIVVINDVTAIRNKEREMIFLAERDQTTGLFNRNHFVEHGRERIENQPSEPFGLVRVGLDSFRGFNEALGHHYGDFILREVANRLQHATTGEPGVTLSRVGGDEFSFYVQGETIEEVEQKGRERAKEALDEIRRDMILDGYHIVLRASASVSHYPDDGQTMADLLKVNDANLHAAKMAGGNCLLDRDGGSGNAARRRFDLQQALEKALGKREMRVAFQPQVALANGEIVGFEALMRWRHNGEWISPSEFIPIAEESDMIVPLTEWIFEIACRRIREWQRQTDEDFTLSINIPPRMLLRDKIDEKLVEMVKKSGLPTSAVVLEITESSFGSDPQMLASQLQKLAMQGFSIAIDDFGTGYSSLSYLSSLPISKLKIDKQFINGIATDPEARKLLDSILAMARTLEFSVVVEGVETKEQLVALKRMDTRMAIQGYVFEPAQNEDFWDGLFLTNKAPTYDIPEIAPGRT